MQTIEKEIIYGVKFRNPITKLNIDKKKGSGYYSIWIIDKSKLSKEFEEELLLRKTNLLYIGIASSDSSLHKRLYEQELQHISSATFFRSIGAVIGFTPQDGSLSDKRNKNNYKFSSADTCEIKNWIDDNLEVSFHYSKVERGIEKELIEKYSPILNWVYNKNKFPLLKSIKDKCRLIARNKHD